MEKPYQTKLTKAELIDVITYVVDAGIRDSRYATYEDWQAAIAGLLSRAEAQAN